MEYFFQNDWISQISKCGLNYNEINNISLLRELDSSEITVIAAQLKAIVKL